MSIDSLPEQHPCGQIFEAEKWLRVTEQELLDLALLIGAYADHPHLNHAATLTNFHAIRCRVLRTKLGKLRRLLSDLLP